MIITFKVPSLSNYTLLHTQIIPFMSKKTMSIALNFELLICALESVGNASKTQALDKHSLPQTSLNIQNDSAAVF